MSLQYIELEETCSFATPQDALPGAAAAAGLSIALFVVSHASLRRCRLRALGSGLPRHRRAKRHFGRNL